MHRWALRRATRVVVLGEDMRQRILAKGVDAARVVVVRDGADLPVAGEAMPALDADVLRAIRGDFSFVMLHAGNLGFYGAWDTLLAAARELARDGVGLVFVGNGAQRESLQRKAGDAKNRFSFSGEQDRFRSGAGDIP
jgi:hypothetical protein